MLFDFKVMILPNKLVDGQVAASNSDHNLILVSFDINSFGPKQVNTILLLNELDFEV